MAIGTSKLWTRSIIYIYIYIYIYIFIPFYIYFSKLLCGELLMTLVILSAILLLIKSTGFWIAFFEGILSAFVADFFSMIKTFLTVFNGEDFANIPLHISSKRQRSVDFTNIRFTGSLNSGSLFMLNFN